MQLGQRQPGFSEWSLAPVKGGWISVTTVTCDTSGMLTLFVMVWLTIAQLVILHRPAGCMKSQLIVSVCGYIDWLGVVYST